MNVAPPTRSDPGSRALKLSVEIDAKARADKIALKRDLKVWPECPGQLDLAESTISYVQIRNLEMKMALQQIFSPGIEPHGHKGLKSNNETGLHFFNGKQILLALAQSHNFGPCTGHSPCTGQGDTFSQPSTYPSQSPSTHSMCLA